MLYDKLVASLRKYFLEPRSEYFFYKDGLFGFDNNGYEHSWAALKDLCTLSQNLGQKGLVLLFDEFEDVITNLNNISYQESAFWNLFTFYAGRKFPGISFFAVTPQFVEKCKTLLMRKGKWDYDFSRFEVIPSFQISPLDKAQLRSLTLKIAKVHGLAYDWKPTSEISEKEMDSVIDEAISVPVQDRTRQAICSIVRFLDQIFQEKVNV